MNFYNYVSKAKVDMLLPQVPLTFKKEFAAEVGINLGVLTVKISSKVPSGFDEDDIRRLEVVTKFIDSERPVGNLEQSKEWVRDTLQVKLLSVDENPDLFMLVGKKYGACHLLAGSAHHVIGNVRSEKAKIGYSYFPYLAKALDEEELDTMVKIRDARVDPGVTEGILVPAIRQHEWADVVRALYEESTAPEYRVEFLARYYVSGMALRGVMCTASSPLYVRQL